MKFEKSNLASQSDPQGPAPALGPDRLSICDYSKFKYGLGNILLSAKKSRYQPHSSYQPKHADHKYASKINLGNYEHPKLSQQKQNQAEAKERKQDGLFENRKKGLNNLF